VLDEVEAGVVRLTRPGLRYEHGGDPVQAIVGVVVVD
jgi:hypothetical protein